jgi:hypothetical protein
VTGGYRDRLFDQTTADTSDDPVGTVGIRFGQREAEDQHHQHQLDQDDEPVFSARHGGPDHRENRSRDSDQPRARRKHAVSDKPFLAGTNQIAGDCDNHPWPSFHLLRMPEIFVVGKNSRSLRRDA